MTPWMRAALVLLLVPASPISAGRAQEPSGVIAGRVTTTSAALLAGADVRLSRVGPGPTGPSVRTAVSNERGAFRFDGLPPGRYIVSGSSPGYTSSQPAPAGVAPITVDVSLPLGYAAGPSMLLSEGEQVLGLEVMMFRQATIAGRILRPDGTPAPGLSVFVAHNTWSGQTWLAQPPATSEWDGRYRVTGLPPGRYKVAVNSPDLPTQRPLTNTFYPGVDDAADAEPVTAIEGISTEGIDIWLTPPRRFAVEGRVYWGVGLAPQDIAIEYGDPEGTHSAAWIVSDPGGLFTITDAPPGTLVLLARADSDIGPLAALATTEVTVDRVYDIALTLDRPGRLSGRVTYEPGVDSTVRPLTLRQTLLRTTALYRVPTSSIDEAGGFAFDNLLGEYAFELAGSPPGLGVTRVLRSGMPLPDGRIRVAGGERVTGVEVVVGPTP